MCIFTYIHIYNETSNSSSRNITKILFSTCEPATTISYIFTCVEMCVREHLSLTHKTRGLMLDIATDIYIEYGTRDILC